MPINTEREYRNMQLSVVEEHTEEQEEQYIVRGYASTFNQPYTLFENEDLTYQEVVASDAFSNTNMEDVIMQYDHEGRVFARISNDTLRVVPDERGLLIEAYLGGTELGRQLYEDIRGGYINKMSFGFTVDGEKETRDKGSDGHVNITRTITSVKRLYDVSAVSIPANDATSISVRSLSDGVIAQIEAERLQAEQMELQRQKLQLRLKLMKGD